MLGAGTRVHSKGPHVETTSRRAIMWTLALDPRIHALGGGPFFFQSFCAQANVDVELQDPSMLLNTSLRAGSSAPRSTMASCRSLFLSRRQRASFAAAPGCRLQLPDAKQQLFSQLSLMVPAGHTGNLAGPWELSLEVLRSLLRPLLGCFSLRS